MREIKFRAWDAHDKKWRYSTDSDHESYFWQFVDTYLDSGTRKTLTQYTTLKDKNGKEIYDGDIVKHLDRTGKVYQADSGIWMVRWREEKRDQSVISMRLTILHSDFPCDYECEIVGNIHENFELLNENN